MEAHKNIIESCERVINNYDWYNKSVDAGNRSVETKIKDLGKHKLCYSQLTYPDSSDYFSVLYFVEVNNPSKRIDFDHYYWRNDPAISRVIKVSCDESGVVINSSKKEDNDKHSFIDINRIIIEKNKEYGAQYLTSEFPTPVSIAEICSAIETLNIERFFVGFPTYKMEKAKAKELINNKQLKNTSN